MLFLPQKGRLLYQGMGKNTVGDATPGTDVTTGGAASTKGSYVSFGTLNFDVYMIRVHCNGYHASASNTNLCVDIAAYAATQEIIIPDLLMGNASTIGDGVGSGRFSPLFPLYIPSGTELWARAAGQRVSTIVRTYIEVWGGKEIPGFPVGRKVTTYGIGTVPTGTTVVPGASGAQGSYTQITASTSEDHFAVAPGWQVGDDTTKTGGNHIVSIGVGAATEETLDSTWSWDLTGTEAMNGCHNPMMHYADIPSGTRLAVRASISSAVDTGNYNAVIHAVS
jgi:hypothetical protein